MRIPLLSQGLGDNSAVKTRRYEGGRNIRLVKNGMAAFGPLRTLGGERVDTNLSLPPGNGVDSAR